jgi:putative hydrolase of the HAD superfamily
VLDALRAAGWRLGLVSNCTGEVPGLWKRTPFASRFDTVAFSCVVGAAKPDPAIFLAAVAGLGLSPNECRYVGDGRDDELAAAAGLGMAPIRMVGFRHDDAAWPRERISSLLELLPLLGL